MSEVLYLHQTFTDYGSDEFTHFGMSTCQMCLQVMESSLIRLRFLGIFIKLLQIVLEKAFQTPSVLFSVKADK